MKDMRYLLFAPLVALLLCLPPQQILAQNADGVSYSANSMKSAGAGANKHVLLERNVKIEFNGGRTKIWGHKAKYFEGAGKMEVTGRGKKRVRVADGPNIKIASKRLFYDVKQEQANFRDNVRYNDGQMDLYTDFLDYNGTIGEAIFFNGGRIEDGEMTLTSDRGFYNSNEETMRFRGNVKMVDPEYTILSDSLDYFTATEMVVFKGATKIIDKDGSVLDANAGGSYNTKSQEFNFQEATITTEEYTMSGDDLSRSRVTGNRTLKGNVVIESEENGVIIFSDAAEYDDNTKETVVYGAPLMKRPFDGDTLFLRCDTLVSIEDTVAGRRLVAWGGVQIFREDLQGVADSLVYNFSDSTIYMFRDPVLWADQAQITADSINILLANNKIDMLLAKSNAFMISQDTIVADFNQMKGRRMITHFDSSRISLLEVFGNGESIYFVLEEDSILVGMNSILCGNMNIIFSKGQVQDIEFFNNPDANFYPPDRINPTNSRLEGFDWKAETRPMLQQMLDRTIAKTHEAKPLVEDNKPPVAPSTEEGKRVP